MTTGPRGSSQSTSDPSVPSAGVTTPAHVHPPAPEVRPWLRHHSVQIRLPTSPQFETKDETKVSQTKGAFFVDEFGVFRDTMNMTLGSKTTSLELLILDTELDFIDLSIEAGNQMLNFTLTLEDSQEMMLIDGRRAFDTIDMLTTSYNNRWCASASIHEGGSSYESAAEAMKVKWEEYGFDLVEVTRYDDDPDQLNVVGYKYGLVYPEQYIVIGGHFDVAYAFTPPGGGTSEGAIPYKIRGRVWWSKQQGD